MLRILFVGALIALAGCGASKSQIEEAERRGEEAARKRILAEWRVKDQTERIRLAKKLLDIMEMQFTMRSIMRESTGHLWVPSTPALDRLRSDVESLGPCPRTTGAGEEVDRWSESVKLCFAAFRARASDNDWLELQARVTPPSPIPER